jgi:hypothetical protein
MARTRVEEGGGMMKRLGLLLVVILSMAASPALADERGFYVGGGIGKSTLDVSDFYPETEYFRGSQSNFGYKLYGGYRFLNFLAVEAAFSDLGSIKVWDPSSNIYTDEISMGVKGWNANALGILPLGKVDLYAKIGAMAYDADVTKKTREGSESETFSGTDFMYGLGIQFNFKNLAARGEADFYNIEDVDNILMFSISLMWRF